MSKTITPAEPEMAEVLNELIARADAITEAQRLGEASFKQWLYVQINEIADALGYIIQGLSELIKDLGYSFYSGFNQGRERAKKNSIRRKYKG